METRLYSYKTLRTFTTHTHRFTGKRVLNFFHKFLKGETVVALLSALSSWMVLIAKQIFEEGKLLTSNLKNEKSIAIVLSIVFRYLTDLYCLTSTHA